MTESTRKYVVGAAASGEAREQHHQVAREYQDRPAAGDYHDREHEHRLGEVEPLQVVDGRALAARTEEQQNEQHRPEAPNTTSTSPRRCHRPACAGATAARCAKSFVANV